MYTLLVDASYLFKKSFLGGKNIYSKGKSIGGLYVFYNSLRKLYLKFPINKTILMWDGENSGKKRYYIYEGYKANRESKSWYNRITLTEKQVDYEENAEESALWQKVRIQQYAEELFMRQIMVHEIEGDDLIAYYCLNKKENENVLIYTNDRDFSQLLSINNVSIYFDNLDSLVDQLTFEIYFNFHYKNALTLKILCGDNSDNINGIERLGEDTLLKYFPELKERYVMVNEIMKRSFEINEEREKNKKGRLKVLDNIINGREIFIRNKKLMDLHRPFVNDEVKKLHKELYYPMNPDDRGSKNLISYINEDGFLDHFYKYNFSEFFKPFFTSITDEIKFYNDVKKNNIIRRKI